MKNKSSHIGNKISSKEGFDIIDCDHCGYAHRNPLPSRDEVGQIYKNDYYETIKPEMLSNYEKSIDWFNLTYDDRIDVFEAELGAKGKILDIGAGAGYFLKRAHERGWKGLGVEASRAACEYAVKFNDVDIINELVENISETDIGLVDAINVSEVLEHVIDPGAIIEKCHKLLDEKGILFIKVPNDFNKLQIAARAIFPVIPEYWLVPKEHYNYFNLDSIKGLVESLGFKVFKTEASFPVEFLLLSGIDYIVNRDIGRSFYTHVKTMELNLKNNGFGDIKRDIYQKFSQMGIGRDIMIYAKKLR